MSEAILTLKDVNKRFAGHTAVDRLSLAVNEGELFTLLGPSGCGKSTTLRMIAGLEDADSGEIWLRNQLLSAPLQNQFIAPQHRRMGMVFQSYAVWPHLSVFENIAYPLRLRGASKRHIQEQVSRTVNLVGLEGLGQRSATALSGGQQQRVALARALVYEPQILLLDEPFSSLDVKLREQLRVELRHLQRRIGVTVILVTHDQLEALSLSDRIAVMSQGKLEQIGGPKDIYERPATAFVRDFLGRSNKLEARVVGQSRDGMVEVKLDGCETIMIGERTGDTELRVGQAVVVSIRPEDVVMSKQSNGCASNELTGIVSTELYLGDRSECYVRSGDRDVLSLLPKSIRFRESEAVFIQFPRRAVKIWSR